MAEKKSIITYFNSCKAMVHAIESKRASDGDYIPSEAELTPIRDTFNEIKHFIEQHLILAHDSFYGSVLLNMESEIDFTIRGGTDVKIDTMGNFTIKFNPLFLLSKEFNYDFPRMETMIIGEILRIVYNHPASYAEKNPMRDPKKHKNLEDSSDASMNNLIENDIHLDKNNPNACLKVPKEIYSLSAMRAELNKPVDRDKPIDYYFEILERFRKFPPEQEAPGGGGGGGSSQNSQNDQNGENQVNDPNGIGGDKNRPAMPNNKDGKQNHNWEEELDPDKASEATKQFVQAVMDSMSEKARGLMPGSLTSAIKKLLAPPEINWAQMFARMLGSIPHGHRKTSMRLNRRQPYRFDLSGTFRDRKVKVVVCIDTSGSMSDRIIAYCMKEIFHIAKAVEVEITIIECDSSVKRVYTAKSPNDVKPNVTGRGGTYFTPAIEYINEHAEFRDALMVYFTDGYGEYEIPKPKTYKNLWVVIEDEKCLSVKEPYGVVKSLKGDKNFKLY